MSWDASAFAANKLKKMIRDLDPSSQTITIPTGADASVLLKANTDEDLGDIEEVYSDIEVEEIAVTLPYNFTQGSAVVFNNEIHILGAGATDDRTKHYKWNGSSWTEVSTLPYGFYRGSAIVYNNEIHILGGAGNPTGHYKWNGSSWTEVSTLPYDFYYGSAVVYNNEIHILGSSSSSNQDKHYKWNGSSWTSVSTLPYAFTQGSAVVYNNEIHILGSGTSSNQKKHYKWNGSRWTEVSTLPYNNFRYGSAVVFNNEIHILGSNVSDNRTKHYKWNGSRWNPVSTLPYEFYQGSAVVFNNKIHILGGTVSTLSFYNYDDSSWGVVRVPVYHLRSKLDFSNGVVVIYNNEIHLIWDKNHYKWTGKTYVKVSTIPSNIGTISDAVEYNNELYIIYYNDSSYGTANTHLSKWDGTSWTHVCTLHYSLRDGTARVVVYNNELHMFGMTNVGGSHQKWNENITDTTFGSLPYNFRDAPAIVYNNEIHILGGGGREEDEYKHYKWNGSSWSEVSTLPYAFRNGSAVVIDNELHILGGGASIGSTTSGGNYTKHYKWNGTTWIEVASLPYSFNANSAVVYNNEIHMLGCLSSSYPSKHYRINAGISSVPAGAELEGIAKLTGQSA